MTCALLFHVWRKSAPLGIHLQQIKSGWPSHSFDAAIGTRHSKLWERANSTELRQDPKSLLDLARLQVVLGADGALNSAYLARRHGIDDPATHTGYMEVFQGGERALAEPEVVGPGTAICLRSDSTARWWYVLDQDEQSLSGNEVPATSELARKLVGHRVGDSVVLRQDLEDLSYQIIEIQSKYVRAYQESMEEFSTRFPDNRSVSRISIADNDFSKLFHGIDQMVQQGHQADQLYQEKRLPFASLCSLLGKPVLEVWRAYTEDDSKSIFMVAELTKRPTIQARCSVMPTVCLWIHSHSLRLTV